MTDEQRIKELEEALMFYAHASNWMIHSNDYGNSFNSPATRDRGAKARAVLNRKN